ncbi:MAG: MarR family transcriptional regulator [Rhodospirillaceae bacterium]|jgi:DNA-binding MarR family transcriptional regulator|nr:MarR family transcriptional regulator [Rhodospirillaceae bacterium]
MNEITEQSGTKDADSLDRFQFEKFVPYLLNQAMSQLDNNLRYGLKSFNISIHQWRVLFMLKISGSCSIGEISAATVMGQSTITRVADQLENANFAVRTPLENNNRVILLSLTEAGKDLIEKVIPVVFSIHDGSVEDFDPDEKRILFKALQKLAANLRRLEVKQKIGEF